MPEKNFVTATVCCEHYNIQLAFIQSLEQYGFIRTVTIDSDEFIDADELPVIEKFIHLHYELDINMEGIEAISFLLERVQHMQDEIVRLKSKLNVYQDRVF